MIELPSGNLVCETPRYRQNTQSFKLSYRASLLNFIGSREIDEVSDKWRLRMQGEIEDLDNEINPVTIKDFSNKK